jgi:hypothetical protein
MGAGIRIGVAGSPFQVATDSQGRFFFADLPAGTFTVLAGKLGYNGESRVTDVADGERIADLRIRISKMASLSGTVRDDSGDPVVGMSVQEFRRTLVNGRVTWQSIGASRTDDRGAYRFSGFPTGAPAGDYLVCACGRDPIPFDTLLLTSLAAEPTQLMGVAARALKVGADVASLDSTLRTYAPTFNPSSLTMARATLVTLTSGEDKTGVDIDVTAARSTRISGTIVGAIGPVQASSIRLVPAGENSDGAALAVSGAFALGLSPTLVQPDGRFDFTGVPPGQYILRVTHTPTDGRAGGAPSGPALAFLGARGYAMSQSGAAPLPNEPQQWASEPVTVGDDGVSGLSVALRRAQSISGRVQFVGASAQPAAPALGRTFVVPVPVDSNAQGLFGGTVLGRFSSDATFALPGVLPGRYALTVGGVLFPDWPTLKSVVVSGVDMTDLPVEMGGADISDVVITFIDTPMATLSGTVATGQNPPGADVSVLVFPSDRRYWADPAAAGRRFRSATVSRSGAFSVAAGFPAGEYFVVAVPADEAIDWQDATRLDRLSRGAQRVALADGDKKAIAVKR